MKIASFLQDGAAGYGIVEADTLRPASAAFRASHPTLRDAIAAGALAALAEDCAGAAAIRLQNLALLPPIPDPKRVICVGINYPKRYPLDGKVVRPDNIILFAKLPGTLLGAEAALHIPAGDAAASLDYEAEIAVVIGKPGRHIARERAFDHIAGYTVLNDGSVRDWQKHSVHAGKNFAGTGACGPWMVTPDEIASVDDLTITTRLNGEVVQHAPARDMFFPIDALLAYISALGPLDAGDIIATGSPDGSGGSRTPQRFLRAGDRLEMEIGGIGVLRNRVGTHG